MIARTLSTIVKLAGFAPVVWSANFIHAAEADSSPAIQAHISVATRVLPMADLGPQNSWPRFRFQLPNVPVRVSAELSDEDRRGTFTNATVPPLPYLIQDNYGRKRHNGELPTIQLENAALRATFYPTLGGRMASLYDKRSSRELLFDNPVLQFANLAIRNAWFSGGVEWNGPLYGHSLLTCSPVYAGMVETPRGPLLRLYEFDRALETTWQVDLLLPANDDRIWMHVKAINPNAHDVQFYWWTNIAVPLTKGTRVMAPADYALSHEASGNARMPFPSFDGFDGSYPLNYPRAKSVFFRKPSIQKPWSVCLDAEGHGICHVSTSTLFGRKFFTWGTNRGGKHWMDYLSENGRGNYIEIQGGVAPTQLQTRPLAAGASIEWTECISALSMDPQAAHSPDYAAASAAAGKVIDGRVPNSTLDTMNAFFVAQTATPVAHLLHQGSGWGWLHEKQTGRQISPGLKFEPAPGDEERPWAELLDSGTFTVGTFSAATLGKLPCSYNVSAPWKAVLEESMRAHGATWLHHFYLGVAEMEQGAFGKAQEHFNASLALKDNAPARRCMALLHVRSGNLDEANADYLKSWSLCGNDANLAVEVAEFLAGHKRYGDFHAFVKSLPVAIADHERIALAQTRVALDEGDFAKVRRLLLREYCTIREGEVSLSELWADSYLKESEARLGRKLSTDEQEKLRQKFPPPPQIDFSMK